MARSAGHQLLVALTWQQVERVTHVQEVLVCVTWALCAVGLIAVDQCPLLLPCADLFCTCTGE
jgi:hypothetical protein